MTKLLGKEVKVGTKVRTSYHYGKVSSISQKDNMFGIKLTHGTSYSVNPDGYVHGYREPDYNRDVIEVLDDCASGRSHLDDCDEPSTTGDNLCQDSRTQTHNNRRDNEMAFEVGKKYKDTRGDTFKFIGSTTSGTLVFERLSTGLVTVRKSDGTITFPPGAGDIWDILPQEAREPRKVEGIVYVNEYTSTTTNLTSIGTVFGHAVGIYDTEARAKSCFGALATRVGVKYKISLEEILD